MEDKIEEVQKFIDSMNKREQEKKEKNLFGLNIRNPMI